MHEMYKELLRARETVRSDPEDVKQTLQDIATCLELASDALRDAAFLGAPIVPSIDKALENLGPWEEDKTGLF